MRVLIVEDEPDLLRVLSQFLDEGGYAVDVAADGRDALHKAMGVEYNAVVLDLMLPPAYPGMLNRTGCGGRPLMSVR